MFNVKDGLYFCIELYYVKLNVFKHYYQHFYKFFSGKNEGSKSWNIKKYIHAYISFFRGWPKGLTIVLGQD